MTVAVFIYALCEPSGEVRYVGQSADPATRFNHHRTHGTVNVRAWFSALEAKGTGATLCILREVAPGADADVAERLAIGEQQARGARLLNVQRTGRGQVLDFVPKNLGAKLLSELGIAQHEVARTIGGTQPMVHHWVHGLRLPAARYRAKLEDAYGIYWRLWDQPTVSEAA